MRQDPSHTTQECCQALEVSRSGFYDHCHKAQGQRRCEDRAIAVEVAEAFHASRKTYGTPRLRIELGAQGRHTSRRRIARLMRQQDFHVLQKRRYLPRTTDSNHGRQPAAHLFKDSAPPAALNEAWVTDITYIPTKEGWLYLAAEMDRCSRRILGWSTADHLETSLVLQALSKAVTTRSAPLPGLVHHSDQGCQYASGQFTQTLADLDITQSMSRRGNCYDNATAESFWATLKAECFGHLIPNTRAQAKSMIFDYIETFYNPVRRHSSLGYLSPLNFEHQLSLN